MAEGKPASRSRRRFLLPALLLAAAAAALVLLLIPNGPARPDLPALAPFGATDRVLVLAPHEDDETLGAGGAIQQALSAGGAVRAVYLTQGDMSGWSSAVRRGAGAAATPESRLALGRLRRGEALKATARLGLAPDQVVFLGYPDGGNLEIWKRHWGPAAPLRSPATGAEAVPYADATAAGRPHKGEAILEDVTRQLLDFRPTRVLVSHPQDRHGDHQAGALFLLAARLGAADRLPAPEVLAYPVHSGEWPRPRGDHSGWWLPVPPELAASPFPWRSLALSAAEVTVKGEALRLHESQMQSIGRELLPLVRRNELFAEVRALPLPSDRAPRAEPSGPLTCLEAYLDLELEIDLSSLAPRGGAVTVCAFGQRRDRPFGQMPKLRAVWAPGAGVKLFDQEVALSDQPRAVCLHGRLTMLLPWAALGDPENVFVLVSGDGAGEDARQAGWLIFRRGR